MPPLIPPLPAGFDLQREFPILQKWRFFNHSGVSPITAAGAAALREFAHESVTNAYMEARWYARADKVRQLAARLIHASPDEIAFEKNTSEGLAWVANGIDWRPGDEIISTAVEYPANVYPWMDLQNRLGTEHIMLPETGGRILKDHLFAAVTPRTRMIALSHVEYASGYRNDLAAIGKFCRERGIWLCVDAIQSCGVVPVDVQAMNIDFLSADGHKWMLGPEGLGIFYCRHDLIPHVRPELGWMNVINATDYGNFDLTLRSDAKRFECGSLNIPGILAFGAGLELIHAIGIDLIWARVYALTSLLVTLLEQKGYQVISPRATEAESSGIVSFVSPTHDHDQIVKDLEARKIILVQREKRLRIAPHFYNTPEHIEEVVAALPGH